MVITSFVETDAFLTVEAKKIVVNVPCASSDSNMPHLCNSSNLNHKKSVLGVAKLIADRSRIGISNKCSDTMLVLEPKEMNSDERKK